MQSLPHHAGAARRAGPPGGRRLPPRRHPTPRDPRRSEAGRAPARRAPATPTRRCRRSVDRGAARAGASLPATDREPGSWRCERSRPETMSLRRRQASARRREARPARHLPRRHRGRGCEARGDKADVLAGERAPRTRACRPDARARRGARRSVPRRHAPSARVRPSALLSVDSGLAMAGELTKKVVVIGEDDEPIATLLRDAINDEPTYQSVVVSDGALVL